MAEYMDLHQLAHGTVVKDSSGQVWIVTKHHDETWLCPFSDEYSFSIRADGSTYALGDTPTLPLTVIGESTYG